MTTIDPQPVIYIVSACGVLFAVVMLLWQRYRLRKPATPQPVTPAAPAPVVPQARLDDDVSPFCLYCEAPAVRAPSRLLGAVGLGAELRVRLGMAPAYSPRVDDRLRPSLCETHHGGTYWTEVRTGHAGWPQAQFEECAKDARLVVPA